MALSVSLTRRSEVYERFSHPQLSMRSWVSVMMVTTCLSLAPPILVNPSVWGEGESHFDDDRRLGRPFTDEGEPIGRI
jgi:hypothetical protein